MNKKIIIIAVISFVLVVIAGIAAGVFVGNMIKNSSDSTAAEEYTEPFIEEESGNINNASEEAQPEASEKDSQPATVIHTVTETTHIIASEETYEGAPDLSKEEEYVNIPAESNTAEAEKEEKPQRDSSDIKEKVLDIIRSNASNTDGEYLIFDGETTETDTEIKFIIRFQRNNALPGSAANKHYANVTVNKNDGTMVLTNILGDEFYYSLW